MFITSAKGAFMSQEIMDRIKKASGADEVGELIGEYRAFLGSEEITVKIYDRPADGMYRFTVHAFVTDDPARAGHGNGGQTIDEALDTYHWDKLTR